MGYTRVQGGHFGPDRRLTIKGLTRRPARRDRAQPPPPQPRPAMARDRAGSTRQTCEYPRPGNQPWRANAQGQPARSRGVDPVGMAASGGPGLAVRGWQSGSGGLGLAVRGWQSGSGSLALAVWADLRGSWFQRSDAPIFAKRFLGRAHAPAVLPKAPDRLSLTKSLKKRDFPISGSDRADHGGATPARRVRKTKVAAVSRISPEWCAIYSDQSAGTACIAPRPPALRRDTQPAPRHWVRCDAQIRLLAK